MTAQEPLPRTAVTTPPSREVATLAGGCFWCTEAIVDALKGVDRVEPGYSGGYKPNPSYEAVCAGTTGHAEAIQVVFDPTVLSYHDLLSLFFTIHDPTTLNRQGADVGTQYRSAIYWHSPEQEATARQVVDEVEKAGIWPTRIVTEITPFTNFYPAEPCHHDYFARHPEQGYCRVVIEPKVAKFRQKYSSLLK
jgi:peptide-methionine (S)-S-oxide reductase